LARNISGRSNVSKVSCRRHRKQRTRDVLPGALPYRHGSPGTTVPTASFTVLLARRPHSCGVVAATGMHVCLSSASASQLGRIGGRHVAPTTSLPTSRPTVLRPATNQVSPSSACASHLGRIGGRDDAHHPSLPTLRPTGNPSLISLGMCRASGVTCYNYSSPVVVVDPVLAAIYPRAG
jgi:hypothetical protein